jgi:hypothetical protein
MVVFKTPGSDSNTAEFIAAGETAGISNNKGYVEYPKTSPPARTTYDLIVKKQGFTTARQNRINITRTTKVIHVNMVPEGNVVSRLPGKN